MGMLIYSLKEGKEFINKCVTRFLFLKEKK